MAKKIVLGVLALLTLGIVGILVAASMQPDVSHVERSRLIPASPTAIEPFMSDLRKWNTWNPWDAMDPNQQVTYSDPSTGVGAWYSWSGEQTGKGKMTIRAIETDRISYDLEFVEPFESKADVTIAFRAEGQGTRVTWSMDSSQNFMGKVFCVFMDMDAMIGKDFERGLAALERVVTQADAGR